MADTLAKEIEESIRNELFGKVWISIGETSVVFVRLEETKRD